MPGHDTRIEEQKGNDVKAIVIADGNDRYNRFR